MAGQKLFEGNLVRHVGRTGFDPLVVFEVISTTKRGQVRLVRQDNEQPSSCHASCLVLIADIRALSRHDRLHYESVQRMRVEYGLAPDPAIALKLQKQGAA